MTRLSAFRSTVLLAALVFSIGTFALSFAGRKPPRSDHEIVMDLFIRGENRWPEAYAGLMIERMPERIFKQLKFQTHSTFPSYVTHGRVPQRTGRGPVVCWVSLGQGGGYMLLMNRFEGTYQPIWDSLLPVSIIAPRLEFQDLNGDGGNEIIVSGELTDGGYHEWGIVHWGTDTTWVMAPRLDVPGKHLTYNRLIGRSLTFGEADSQGYCRLFLHSPLLGPGESTSDSVRIFKYASDVRGFIPTVRSME